MNRINSIVICALILAAAPHILMYKAYNGMNIKKEKLVAEGYTCRKGKEAYGPPHGRDLMYSCSKDSKTITVGVFGKPVTGKYVLYD